MCVQRTHLRTRHAHAHTVRTDTHRDTPAGRSPQQGAIEYSTGRGSGGPPCLRPSPRRPRCRPCPAQSNRTDTQACTLYTHTHLIQTRTRARAHTYQDTRTLRRTHTHEEHTRARTHTNTRTPSHEVSARGLYRFEARRYAPTKHVPLIAHLLAAQSTARYPWAGT
jgi:hypothetical protein